MSAKQAAFLTSRVISLWLFYRAFANFMSLPNSYLLLPVLSAFNQSPNHLTLLQSRLFLSSLVTLAQLLIEIVLAVVFYRFGPVVARFLLPPDAEMEAGPANEA